MKTSLQKYINLNTCLALVVLVTVAISAQKIFQEKNRTKERYPLSYYNNYLIFEQSSYHLVEQKDLYERYPEYWDLYKYSPAFSLFFFPFAVMPAWLGLTLWNLLNVLVFFFALWWFPFADYKKKLLAFIFTFIELTTSTHSAQSNGLIAGLLLFSFLFFEKKKFFIGTLLIALSVYIKLFGAVAFIMILLYPERWKAGLYAAFWLVVLALIPLVVVPFHQLKFLYQSWFRMLASDHAVSDGYSVMGCLRSWFHLEIDKIIVAICGVVLLLLPLLKFRYYKDNLFRITMLASVMVWCVIFNHKAESPTFIIAVAGIAVWFFSKTRASAIDIMLLSLALLLTVLSPTDIFPKSLRDNYIIPYSLKALPCILIWGKILYELLVWKENVTREEEVSPS